MQGLSSKGLQRDSGLRAEVAGLGLESRPVNVVAEQWVTDRRQMDADLVGTAGFEPAGQETGDRRAVAADIAFEHLPVRDGLAAAGTHRHLVARARVAIDRL